MSWWDKKPDWSKPKNKLSSITNKIAGKMSWKKQTNKTKPSLKHLQECDRVATIILNTQVSSQVSKGNPQGKVGWREDKEEESEIRVVGGSLNHGCPWGHLLIFVIHF